MKLKNQKSQDGITLEQATKFFKKFTSLSNLRLENGYWVADNEDNPDVPFDTPRPKGSRILGSRTRR